MGNRGKRLFQRAYAYYIAGQYDLASDDFSAIIRQNPGTAWAFLWRGACRLGQDRIDDAIADYSESIRLAPDHASGYLNRGVAHHRNGEYEAALIDYSEGIRLEPDDADFYLYRGQSHVELGHDEEALADFEIALKLNPTCPEAYEQRGYIRQNRGDLHGAIADFTKAIEFGSASTELLNARGEARVELGAWAMAEADFDGADRLDRLTTVSSKSECTASGCLHEPAVETLALDGLVQAGSMGQNTMATQNILVQVLLRDHFHPDPLDALTITERRFPGRVRADLQRAIDGLIAKTMIRHFSGVRKQNAYHGVDFSELLVRDRHDPAISVPPQYEEVDIGEAQPVRCLKDGLWLLEHDGTRLAVFLEPGGEFVHRAFGQTGVRFQVATVNCEAGTAVTQNFFQHLERSIQEARSYRGKILSLEMDPHGYRGTSTGIKVHKLRTVDRDQVILPLRTLELLERNVIQFVRQRPQLAKWGLSTRKGLLFYGPPGVGKTHTLHFLAGAMEGTTTLLISAEQVGLLGEYMTLARLLQPSMVVIEDADLIARERTSMQSVCEEVLLNKLLNEMDGLKEDADILFILTTNRPETLEAALTSRPGRIDQAIEFPLPDDDGRAKLVRLYSRNLEVPESVVRTIVAKTAGVSGACIKELMRRSAQFQIERNATSELTLEDVDQALEELLFSGGSLNRKLLGAQAGDQTPHSN